jgi:diaminopimelate epimerase
MKFAKYHALGNDYIVLDPSYCDRLPTPREMVRLCHRNFGIGSDGIIWGPIRESDGRFRMRIFNPDGSEAEKSGNGIRIFSRYLWDKSLVWMAPFPILTLGSEVQAEVAHDGRFVRLFMGEVSFHSSDITVLGEDREVMNEELTVQGRTFTFSAVTVGNPHCVVIVPDPAESLAREYGPFIETDDRFPRKTNVEFMQVVDRNTIRIEIWERAAGYTLASGSSSGAAAAVARKLGLCDSEITVRMPGGQIEVFVSDDFKVTINGPVTRVCDGTIAPEIFDNP